MGTFWGDQWGWSTEAGGYIFAWVVIDGTSSV